ncbi:unnamed protein product [Urochloa humidicola]
MATQMWLPRAVDIWNEWAIRIATSTSLATHVLLIVLAETRRHNARPELTFALWLVYQIMNKAGSYALAHLSLDTTGPSDKEQIMVAFWAPFLLLHLGGPDNVGAYSLDDDKLSWRKFVASLWKAIGAVYIVFTKIFLANSGPLSVASMIMINIGMFRFFEMAVAILRSLRKKAWGSSNKNQPPVDFSISHCNEGALKIAQGQWQCCGCRALFDSSVEMNSKSLETSRKIFNLGWKDVCKVVEIEASLIYDMLYTKASVVYTIGGYFHRFISPLATSAAIFLFSQYPKNNVEPPDLIITYMVLMFALVLDVMWLVMALASTWTYGFLTARSGTWLHHKVLCSGWWCCFRQFALCLHPCRLLGKDPSSYRMWSNTVGRFNMLQECTRTPGLLKRLCGVLATFLGLADVSKEYRIWKCLSQLPPGVKELVFERIKKRLSGTNAYSMKDIRALWGKEAVNRRKKVFDGLVLPYFGNEFQEDILLWHIATTIYLWSGNQQQLIRGANAATTQLKHVKAIEVLSEYLMFLVILRPHMLPDPALGKLCEVTMKALRDESIKDKENNPGCAARKQKLAEILHSKEKSEKLMDSDPNRRLVSDAARLAIALQEVKATQVKDVVELIFDVWVDKLLYAAIRCPRESHARQLGRGGELITIVWIVAEHAGVFPIGEGSNRPTKPSDNNDGVDSEKTCCQKGPVEPVSPQFCCEKDYYC